MKFVAIVLVGLALLAAGGSSAVADDTANCRSDNPDIAIVACRKLLSAGKLNQQGQAQALVFIARAYSRKGRLIEASAEIARAMSINPRNPDAYLVRANISTQRNEYAAALADLDRALAINPSYAFAHQAKGHVHARKRDYAQAVDAFTRAIEIDRQQASFYADRGAVLARSNTERAFADAQRAIALRPDYFAGYGVRGMVLCLRGEFERGLADINKALELNPRSAAFLAERASVSVYLKDFEKGLLDANRALEIDPRSTTALSVRSRYYLNKGDLGRAMADADTAVAVNPLSSTGHRARGEVYSRRGEFAKAVESFSRAVEIDDKNGEYRALRADALLKLNRQPEAVADLRQVLSLPARRPLERDAQVRSAEILASFETRPSYSPPASGSLPAPSPAPKSAVPSGTRRVAMVIGNSNYTHAGALRNPANDARALVKAFRAAGFTEVIEHYDLGLAAMMGALKAFGDKASGAEWAVIYFAGHGIEMGGTAFLLPTDAKLEQDTHVADEAIPLERMLQKAEAATRLRLVILDACRNNPFAARMVRRSSAVRSIGRGLPQIEPEGDVLVAYATKHGTTALDGDGENSPYAMSLVKRMVEPNVDVRVMFGRVRDDVRGATRGQQEPYTYGSIGGDLHFFVAARP